MTGIICIDKPQEITSFTAVNRVRRILGVKKAGHTGTLDPMATGVLPVMLGGATKFADFLPTHTKAYEADIVFGISTDTYDVTGKVTQTSDKCVSFDEFNEAAQSFLGKSEQLPPMYSAVSQNGVRLYKLARQGVEVEREKRSITVFSIKTAPTDEENVFTLSVSCSAGTYIRSLANDIGEKLGCPACLKRLRRTEANGFTLDDTLTLDSLTELAENGGISQYIKSVDTVLGVYPEITVTDAQSKRFSNGGALAFDRLKNFSRQDGLFRVYSPDRRFLGLGLSNPSKAQLEVARLYIP